jgi:hypothetical protein
MLVAGDDGGFTCVIDSAFIRVRSASKSISVSFRYRGACDDVATTQIVMRSEKFSSTQHNRLVGVESQGSVG